MVVPVGALRRMPMRHEEASRPDDFLSFYRRPLQTFTSIRRSESVPCFRLVPGKYEPAHEPFSCHLFLESPVGNWLYECQPFSDGMLGQLNQQTPQCFAGIWLYWPSLSPKSLSRIGAASIRKDRTFLYCRYEPAPRSSRHYS